MGNQGCLYSTCPRGMVCSHAETQPTERQVLFSIWNHPCCADAVLQRPTQAANTQLTPGVWPPKAWVVTSSPRCCIAAQHRLQLGCSMPNIVQGMQRILHCSVSPEPTAPAAVSTTVRKSLDGTVSPAMLTLLGSRLSLPAPAPAENCSPLPCWGLERW